MKINDKIYQNPLFVFALKAEAGTLFSKFQTVFTGIGKVNATYRLLKAIQNYQPDIIINLGTAGGFGLKKGEIVCCTDFVQRDMDVTPLGFEKFVTPFEENISVVLSYGISKNGIKKAVCGSGDCFEINHTTSLYQVVDMEAYALAKVSKTENIPFLCLKYISDGADDNAATDWKEEVKLASEKLKMVLF